MRREAGTVHSVPGDTVYCPGFALSARLTSPFERNKVLLREMSSGTGAQSAIDEMVRRIAERIAPERIILFGSHARGDAREDSDVDLLVLFPDVDNPRARAAELYAALIDCSALPTDIVVSTTARFERYRNVVNTVYWPAAREGRIVYERAA